MTIKIAIVEDDDQTARQFAEYIKEYSETSGNDIEVVRFCDGMDIVREYKAEWDIIFLDIQMKIMDGLTTAERIRRLDKNTILIFVTNMSQYAVKGYSVDALDFLLKPVPYFAFSQQLKRSIEKIKRRKASFLLLPIKNGIVKMDVSQIIYIESFRHKMLVHTLEGNFNLISTMRELETKLAPDNFSRCNHCYLVNLAFVKAIQNNYVQVGDYSLAISRARKKAFMDALTSYVMGGSKT